ncbi:MAG TPA: LysM peptidoglycan-binding domain-containing protein [Intrasporangium sp.]|uniref:LysM peptidoglycan-binding domain-containing protein n=1 Tax=Intrasporangium sp. TaxID=1925024 RepID=UPI002D76DCD5|nr:LysM peptidoglycan-binding domain-containing protein [Intrasporangium sp.]HET7400003.1 LysM peptidoglycan-binding domain-containing protein [Intrasporangium sp.]
MGRPLAAAAGCAGASAAAVVFLTRSAWETWPAPHAVVRPEDVVLGLLAWAGAALAGWVGLGGLLTALSLLPGALGRLAARVAARVTPRAVRTALAMVLGTSLGTVALPAGAAGSAPLPGRAATTATLVVASAASSGPAPASADSGSDPTASGTPAAEEGAPPAPDPAFHPPAAAAASRGWLPPPPPRRSDADEGRLLAPPPRVTAATAELVTVRRGDTLWSIAARHLGPHASDAEVARAWPQWYAANRGVVGLDPDLLLPGQQLRPPGHGGRP